MFDGSAAEKKKPEKPDEEVYKVSLKKAEKELADSVAKLNAVRAKLDLAQPNSNDSPTAKRRQELVSQLTEIRQQQAGGKAGRNQTFEQIKKLDEQLKSRIAEQKVARSRFAFKNVDEVDREIERLEKQVNGGMMKLVDERRALAETSNLRKQRKGFAGFEEAQKGIDDTKAKLKALRDTLDDPESKALGEKYNTIQAELDAIKAEQEEAYKSVNTLRAERTSLYNEQQEKYMAMRRVKDDYFQQNKAVQKYEYEARQRARERQKTERENYEKERRKERAQKMLAEASDKAYLDEIRLAERLLRFLDPSYSSTKTPLQAPSQFQAQAQRTVDDSGLKGTRVVRKDEREDTYFMGTGGKKGKKGRKTVAESPASTPPATAKYSCPPSVMEDCSAMGVDPPMSAADMPAVREKVKAKLDHWKADQDAQTEKNISKAKKEVERLDAEESATASATPTTNGDSQKATAPVEGGSVSTEIEMTKNAAADVVADLKGASLEDKE
jgi:uncharacterized coiled-coil DUF342 family protein